MKPLISAKEAVSKIKDGDSILVGGFMCCGQTFDLIDALLEQGTKDLTIICNDAGFPDKGIGKLIVERRVKSLIATHIGLNPVAGKMMHSKDMAVELVPQGTLAERIRAGGAGLGGILTPTGVGTKVEEGKQLIYIDERAYILEKAIKADHAFVKANITDENGNAFIAKSAKNFNNVMASAAKNTIVETEKYVKIGELSDEQVSVPCVFVKNIVEASYGR